MRARLITIPFSHYCDKARWALERARVEFVEEPHVPGLSGVFARLAGGNKSVPVLVTEDGAIKESADIVRWADARSGLERLYPEGDDEVERLCARFDRKLGPASRRIAYDQVLRLPGEQLGEMFSFGLSPWEADFARLLAPGLGGLIRRGLKIDDEGVARSKETLDEVFGEVAALLSDGRPYLTGDRFTAADLTFASLAAPAIGPALYVERRFPKGSLDAILAQLADYRETPAGAHALRMYELHR